MPEKSDFESNAIKDTECYEKYFSDKEVPFGKITVETDADKICPDCKIKSQKVEKSSSEETWLSLCGRAVTLWICPECGKVLAKSISLG